MGGMVIQDKPDCSLEELEAAKKEVEKVTGEKPISQKMFKAIWFLEETKMG